MYKSGFHQWLTIQNNIHLSTLIFWSEIFVRKTTEQGKRVKESEGKIPKIYQLNYIFIDGSIHRRQISTI